MTLSINEKQIENILYCTITFYLQYCTIYIHVRVPQTRKRLVSVEPRKIYR